MHAALITSAYRFMVARAAPVTAAALGMALAVPAGGAVAAARPDVVAPRGGDGEAAGTITTVAGGVGGPALGTHVSLLASPFSTRPCDVAFGNGHLYFGDSASVRAVSPQTGWLTTPAGTGTLGLTGDGVPATAAGLNTCGVAVAAAGNLLLTNGDTVRVVAYGTGTFYGQAMAVGDIYTVAGNGTSGDTGDGGPATAAELDGAAALVLDTNGSMLVAESVGNRVRMVAERAGTFYGQAMTAGDIYTVAGNGSSGYSGDGGPATSATLTAPSGVAVDRNGNLLIADPGSNRIRVVARSTSTFYGVAMTAGDIYTIAGGGTSVASGVPATTAEFDGPGGAAVDSAGNVLIADTGHSVVRVVAAGTGTFYGQAMTAGDIYTVAGGGGPSLGNGGPAVGATLEQPQAVGTDRFGNLVIADTNDFMMRVVAARTGSFYGQAMTAGDIYTVAGNGALYHAGDGGLATSAQMPGPTGLAVDPAGDMMITTRTTVEMVAGRSASLYGHMRTAGHIYMLMAASSKVFAGVAVDHAGNLLISEDFDIWPDNRIQVLAGASGTFYGQAMTVGNVYTIAGGGGSLRNGIPATPARLKHPEGIAVDGAGNVLIADTDSERVRVVAAKTGTFYGHVMTAGDIYTVAGTGTGQPGFSGDGGPGASAQLAGPSGVAVDSAGNLLVADAFNNRIRVVAARTGTFYGQAMTRGHIYTVAGGTGGFAGDGGPATAAELAGPSGVAVDGAGNLLVADAFNNRIRVVAEQTGTFYGVAMTAGDIYTVAGDGTVGFAGDGGPAVAAQMWTSSVPQGVAVAPAGNLLFTDTLNDRVRQVSG